MQNECSAIDNRRSVLSCLFLFCLAQEKEPAAQNATRCKTKMVVYTKLSKHASAIKQIAGKVKL